jgi:hypothetical protein
VSLISEVFCCISFRLTSISLLCDAYSNQLTLVSPKPRIAGNNLHCPVVVAVATALWGLSPDLFQNCYTQHLLIHEFIVDLSRIYDP